MKWQFAIITENTDELQELLDEHGISVFYTDTDNESALHLACKLKKYKSVKFLLQNGIDVDIVYRGWTPLQYCCSVNLDISLIQLLLDYSANVNYRDSNGHTALHLACNNRYYHIIKLLLQNGSDINTRDHNNCTIFNILSYDLCVNTIYAAHKLGITISLDTLNRRNSKGYSLLHLACFQDDIKTIQMLIDLGVDTDFDSINGQCALNAIVKENKECINLLLECGVQFDAKLVTKIQQMPQYISSLHENIKSYKRYSLIKYISPQHHHLFPEMIVKAALRGIYD